MKQEEKYQIQKNDYFLYYGETVKVVGRSPYNENDYSVENKNGSKFYAEVEELEPIVINEYTLVRGGIRRDSALKRVYKYKNIWINCEGNGFVQTISRPFDELNMEIRHLHILQNALRLFGVEVELKQ